MTTEREKCIEIWSSFGWPNPADDLLILTAEARDMARREALETTAQIADRQAKNMVTPAAIMACEKIAVDIRSLISQPSPETRRNMSQDDVDAADRALRRSSEYLYDVAPDIATKSASASVPAEPDPYEDEWVTKVQEALDSLDLEPPDSEAWKRVPVDAGMLIQIWDGWEMPVTFREATERAARAKLGE